MKLFLEESPIIFFFENRGELHFISVYLSLSLIASLNSEMIPLLIPSTTSSFVGLRTPSATDPTALPLPSHSTLQKAVAH